MPADRPVRTWHWHWPTDEGWLLVVVLTFAGLIAGGWGGGAIMLGFFVFTNVLGNWMLP